MPNPPVKSVEYLRECAACAASDDAPKEAECLNWAADIIATLPTRREWAAIACALHNPKYEHCVSNSHAAAAGKVDAILEAAKAAQEESDG